MSDNKTDVDQNKVDRVVPHPDAGSNRSESLDVTQPTDYLPLLSAEDAANLLGMNHHTLKASYKKYGIPYFKIGGKVCFSRKDLCEWVLHLRIDPKENTNDLGETLDG